MKHYRNVYFRCMMRYESAQIRNKTKRKYFCSVTGRRQRRRCRSSSWTVRRLLSSTRTQNRATPSLMTSPFARWMSVTPPLPASRRCTRHWPNLCCWGPLKDSTPASLLTAKRALGNRTRECFCFFISYSRPCFTETLSSALFIFFSLVKYMIISQFNSLLFRMMGFGEEEGVIPRFCDELFSRLSSMENKEVKSLLNLNTLTTFFFFCLFNSSDDPFWLYFR